MWLRAPGIAGLARRDLSGACQVDLACGMAVQGCWVPGKGLRNRSLLCNWIENLRAAGRCDSATFLGHAAGKSMGKMIALAGRRRSRCAPWGLTSLAEEQLEVRVNGRAKIQAAFSMQGTPEIPAVICYEDIFVRDHWTQLTGSPWWARHVPDLKAQLAWRRDVSQAVGQDWFELPVGLSRAERAHLAIEECGDGVYVVDRRTGQACLLEPTAAGGWTGGDVVSVHPDGPPRTPEEVNLWLGDPKASDAVLEDGRADLSERILSDWGRTLYPIWSVAAPLWRGYSMWGFEGLMLQLVDRPELVRYAVERFTERTVGQVRSAARLGALGIWIEDCMTDMVGVEHWGSFHLPYLRRITDEIRAQGMHSIHYFCGNPAGKWTMLLDTGADALSLEESKKGFSIDVEDVVDRVDGRMTILGNLDAIGLLEHGSRDDLRVEIGRQIATGRRNGSRFIMSLGSPVTPGTPVLRVRAYCDMVHELGV
jgi:uroporphyrinogen decarboxylase-like protein